MLLISGYGDGCGLNQCPNLMLKSILPGIVEFVIRLRFRVWVGFEVESLPECPAPRDPRVNLWNSEMLVMWLRLIEAFTLNKAITIRSAMNYGHRLVKLPESKCKPSLNDEQVNRDCVIHAHCTWLKVHIDSVMGMRTIMMRHACSSMN